MSVGTDYFGPDLETSERFELERALETAFHERLRNGSETGRELDWSDRSFEFTGGYVFQLLERAAAYSTDSSVEESWDRAIDELLGFVSTTPNTTSCHRIVSHLEIDAPVALGDGEVELRRLEDLGWIDLHAVTGLPGLETESVFLFQRVPHAVLTARGAYHPSPEWSDQLRAPSGSIDRVLLGLRLFRRTSARNIAEWSGFSEPGSFTRPLSSSWPYDTISAAALADAEDTAALSPEDEERFDRFNSMVSDAIDAAQSVVEDRKLGSSGWFTALASFQDSFGFDPWPAQVPRLVRSLEGALLPEPSAEAVKSRLRLRLCLLLQVDEASSNRLFDSVGHLYDLRSEVEHAADAKAAKQLRRLKKVSGSEDTPDGVSQQRAVEELRDLARRAIVARVILAGEPQPIWSIQDDEPIDRRLLEDGFRQRCREKLAEAAEEYGPGLL